MISPETKYLKIAKEIILKYVPKDVKGDKVTGEIREYPAKLLFRIATPRDTE